MSEDLHNTQREFIQKCVEVLGTSPTDLAKRAGIAPSTLNRFLSGVDPTQTLSLRTITALQRVTPVVQAFETETQTGSDIPAMPPPSRLLISGSEFVSVGRYDAALVAGVGSLSDPAAEPLGTMLFESEWLSAITQAAPEKLAVVRVAGDSMESTLSDGDWVLVDRTQKTANREGVYALAVGGACWIRRISLNINAKTVKLTSDSGIYDAQEVAADALEVIGRVFWIVGKKI